jgi:hypothetical protein
MGQWNLHLLQSKTNKIKNVKERPINDALRKMGHYSMECPNVLKESMSSSLHWLIMEDKGKVQVHLIKVIWRKG